MKNNENVSWDVKCWGIDCPVAFKCYRAGGRKYDGSDGEIMARGTLQEGVDDPCQLFISEYDGHYWKWKNTSLKELGARAFSESKWAIYLKTK